MNKEYMKKLFDVLGQIDDLTEPIKELEQQEEKEKSMRVIKGETCMDGENEIPKYTTVKVPERVHSRRYSSEFKKMIVKLHKDDGRSFVSLREEFGVSKATITKWCSDARYENRAKLQERTMELMNAKQEYEKVKQENAFLKKVVIMILGQEMKIQD